jgi:hypothetical protein
MGLQDVSFHVVPDRRGSPEHVRDGGQGEQVQVQARHTVADEAFGRDQLVVACGKCTGHVGTLLFGAKRFTPTRQSAMEASQDQ